MQGSYRYTVEKFTVKKKDSASRKDKINHREFRKRRQNRHEEMA